MNAGSQTAKEPVGVVTLCEKQEPAYVAFPLNPVQFIGGNLSNWWQSIPRPNFFGSLMPVKDELLPKSNPNPHDGLVEQSESAQFVKPSESSSPGIIQSSTEAPPLLFTHPRNPLSDPNFVVAFAAVPIQAHPPAIALAVQVD